MDLKESTKDILGGLLDDSQAELSNKDNAALDNMHLVLKKIFINWRKKVGTLAGNDESVVDEWIKNFNDTFEEDLVHIYLDLLRFDDETKEKMTKLLQSFENKSKILRIPIPADLGMENLGLLEHKYRLEQRIISLDAEIAERKSEYDQLVEKHMEISTFLDIEPTFKLKYPPLPTQSELNEMKTKIEQLEQLKYDFIEKCTTTEENIKKICLEIKYQPDSDFERLVLTEGGVPVNKQNFKKLELFEKCLIAKRLNMIDEIEVLREKVEDFWKLLDVELKDRDEFRTLNEATNLITLANLQTETARLAELKMANIQVFINKYREDLKMLWDQCYCTELEKLSFKFLHDECYTVDLLELHEMEVKKWKDFYKANENIINSIQEYDKLVTRGMELEENAAGADRYKNRGGVLLKEEKERNKITKRIPELEQHILQLSVDFEMNNGKPFLIFGITPENFIREKHEERENMKKLKLSARKQHQQQDGICNSARKRPLTPLFSSASKILTTTSTTPSSLRTPLKRRILTTTPSASGLSKKIRCNDGGTPIIITSGKKSSSKKRIGVATRVLSKRSRISMEAKKRRRSARRSSTDADVKIIITPSTPSAAEQLYNKRDTTYSIFAGELSTNPANSTFLQTVDENVPSTSAAAAAAPRTPKTPRTPRTPKITTRRGTPSATDKSGKTTKMSTCRSNVRLDF